MDITAVNHEFEGDSQIEFMRKNRFEKIKSKFSSVSEDANEVIAKAKPTDILALTLTFNSPVKIIKAELFDEKKFVDLAF